MDRNNGQRSEQKESRNRFQGKKRESGQLHDVKRHTGNLSKEELRELESIIRYDDGFKDEEADQRNKKAGSPLASLGSYPATYFTYEDEHPPITDVLPLQFQRAGKIFWYYVPAEVQEREEIQEGDFVVAYSERGVELGKVLHRTEHLYQKVRKIDFIKNGFIRKATSVDLEKRAVLNQKAAEARVHAQEINDHLGLRMKIIRVKYTIDDSKCIIYFVAPGRVDFREFIRQLASILHRRIEMRQIGVRDTTKMMGGLGPCGMPLCCSRFMHSFHPVSIKMAKDQGLSLNPSKLSGICGRLFCCLSYENDVYAELQKDFPKEDEKVYDPVEKREGIITKVLVIPKTLQVKFRQKMSDGRYRYEELPIPVSRLEKTKDGEYRLLPPTDTITIDDVDDLIISSLPETELLPAEKAKEKKNRSRRVSSRNNRNSVSSKDGDEQRKKGNGNSRKKFRPPRKRNGGGNDSKERSERRPRGNGNNRKNSSSASSRPQKRTPSPQKNNKPQPKQGS